MLDRREHLYVWPICSRLAPSDLTLDDLTRSKIKVILFDVKYLKNGNTLGPNGGYIDCLWASLWMTWKGYRSRSQSFDSRYLENGDRYKVGPRKHLHVGPTGFRLVPSDLSGQKLRSYFLTWNMSRTARITMLVITEITVITHGLHFGWPWEVTAIAMWGYEVII